jgi:predicted nucleotidyltransferase
MNSIVKEKIPQLVELCKKYSVVRMYLFGSAARDDFDPATSDIDLLVAFSTKVPLLDYADHYFDLLFELEDMFGRKIDLVTERSLSKPYFIANIERDKKLIYVA